MATIMKIHSIANANVVPWEYQLTSADSVYVGLPLQVDHNNIGGESGVYTAQYVDSATHVCMCNKEKTEETIEFEGNGTTYMRIPVIKVRDDIEFEVEEIEED